MTTLLSKAKKLRKQREKNDRIAGANRLEDLRKRENPYVLVTGQLDHTRFQMIRHTTVGCDMPFMTIVFDHTIPVCHVSLYPNSSSVSILAYRPNLAQGWSLQADGEEGFSNVLAEVLSYWV